MHTEDEAREKWCPFARTLLVKTGGTATAVERGQTAFNRAFDDTTNQILSPPSCRCIASECSAWRWDMSPDSDDTNGEVGYCGLAGKL